MLNTPCPICNTDCSISDEQCSFCGCDLNTHGQKQITMKCPVCRAICSPTANSCPDCGERFSSIFQKVSTYAPYLATIIIGAIILVGTYLIVQDSTLDASKRTLPSNRPKGQSTQIARSKPVNSQVIGALKSLKKIQVSAEVGTNSVQYGNRVVDAKFQIDEVLPKVKSRKLKKELRDAISAYVDANLVWTKSESRSTFLGNEEVVCSDAGSISTILHKYKIPILGKNPFPRIILIGECARLDIALSKIWKQASTHVRRIESMAKR